MSREAESRVVQTDSWKLNLPVGLDESAPLLCVPTVHPRGDRRVLRCAQVALDSGFRLCFIWLGQGRSSVHPLIKEVIFPAATTSRARLAQLGKLAAEASAHDPAAWHIHDYYLLPAAKRWHRRTGRPVVYDVHEYYADYYSAKFPLPRVLKGAAARWIEDYQVRSAGAFGGANVVTGQMAAPFRAKGVPLAVTPNYPFRAPLEGTEIAHFRYRRYAVLYMGSLSEEYGSDTLIALARRSRQRGLPFRFDAVARFSRKSDEEEFRRSLADECDGGALHLLPPRAAHEMPALLTGYGFGLSLLKGRGQNPRAIPAKNYEHVLMGLVPVVTDLPAQAGFARAQGGPCVVFDAGDLDGCLDQMLALADNEDLTNERLVESASEARRELTWERAAAPELARLYRELIPSLGDTSR